MKMFDKPICVLETIERWMCGIEEHSHFTRPDALKCINSNKDKKRKRSARLSMDTKILILVDILNGVSLKKAGLNHGTGKHTSLVHAEDAAKYLATRTIIDPTRKTQRVYAAKIFGSDKPMRNGARALKKHRNEYMSCINSRPFGDIPTRVWSDSPYAQTIIDAGYMVEEEDISKYWRFHGGG